MNILDIIIAYKEAFAHGIIITLELCMIIWTIGIIAGTALGYLGSVYRKHIGIPSYIASFLLSSIPIIVLLFWLHYPLQVIFQVNINPFITAAAAISAINIFMVGDIVRNALIKFPAQYTLAAKACGLTRNETFWKIEAPIISQEALPSILNTQVNMLQLTLFASLISVEEIFRMAQRVNAIIYKPVEIYTALAIFFLIICASLNGLALWLKKKYERNLSEN